MGKSTVCYFEGLCFVELNKEFNFDIDSNPADGFYKNSVFVKDLLYSIRVIYVYRYPAFKVYTVLKLISENLLSGVVSCERKFYNNFKITALPVIPEVAIKFLISKGIF